MSVALQSSPALGAKTLTPRTFSEYIWSCPNHTDLMTFSSNAETYKAAEMLRDRIKPWIKMSVGYDFIRLTAQEVVDVGSGRLPVVSRSGKREA